MAVNTANYVRKTISFQVYPATILGSDFTRCKVSIGSMDAAAAAATGYINPPAMHAQVYPTLPSELNVADDYDSYNYVMVTLQDGTKRVIGEPWIVESTLEEFSTGVITVILQNKSVDDVDEIKKILALNNQPPDKVTFKGD